MLNVETDVILSAFMCFKWSKVSVMDFNITSVPCCHYVELSAVLPLPFSQNPV